jgi:hypothetical protein
MGCLIAGLIMTTLTLGLGSIGLFILHAAAGDGVGAMKSLVALGMAFMLGSMLYSLGATPKRILELLREEWRKSP